MQLCLVCVFWTESACGCCKGTRRRRPVNGPYGPLAPSRGGSRGASNERKSSGPERERHTHPPFNLYQMSLEQSQRVQHDVAITPS